MLNNARTVSELLSGIVDFPTQASEIVIHHLCQDSREVMNGSLFFAVPGLRSDGRDCIPQAIEAGASIILYETEGSSPSNVQSTIHSIEQCDQQDCLMLPIHSLQQKISEIAHRFYGNPTEFLSVVAFTGTNGKTSSCHYLAHALQQENITCGIMGTNGYGLPDELISNTHTTPAPIELSQEIAVLKAAGAKALAMEISSHALSQYRADGIAIDIAVFTNLTQDHLDYHSNVKEYAAAKARLFEFKNLKSAVINADDAFGRDLLKTINKKIPCYAYKIDSENKINTDCYLITANDVEMHAQGIKAWIRSPWGEGELSSRLLGKFNLSNLLAVFICLNLLEVPFEKALLSIKQLGPVSGRMQQFTAVNKPIVIVDYAHTPDALLNVLQTIKAHCKGQCWCVFGCGGNRDRSKRAIMGKIAENNADHIVLTNDNPRNEAASLIIDDILTGLKHPNRATIEKNREKAIQYAIEAAKVDDIVLIAGKGHEDYQEIGNERNTFSDIDIVQDIMNKN